MPAAAAGLKLTVAVSVLGCLAACTSPPQRVSAPVTSTVATIQAPLLRASPGLAATPPDVQPDEPTIERAIELTVEPGIERPRPALLAGEFAREYQRGGASWYGPGFHGRRTASGERYDMHGFTAAHRTLPFGTWVRVHSLVNGREVDVRITDRGPFIRSRVIDVSRGAAEALGMLGLGFKEVVILVPESLSVVEVPLPLIKRRGVVRRNPKVR